MPVWVADRREFVLDMIREFSKRLLAIEGENLLQITVFGSVAREEETDDSDIDIFVLLKEYDYHKKYRIYRLAFDVDTEMADHDIIISPFVVGVEEYDRTRKYELIYYNIADEGAVIYDTEG